MKNKYFFTISILLSITLSGLSQITITKSDLITGSDTIRMSQAVGVGVPDPTLTGANYTWDYSNLTPIVQYLDTFLDVSSTPFIYQLFFNNSIFFPKNQATVGHKVADFNFLSIIQMTNTYNYYQNIASGYSMVGSGTTLNGLQVPNLYDSIDVIYKYPVNYGKKDSSISKFIDSIPGTGYYGQRKKRVNSIEGWGTLKTPYGTFSVLKIKSTLYITDTLYYNQYKFGIKIPRPVSYEYKWLSKGKEVPLLEIDATGTLITNVIYRDSLRAGVIHLGVNELTNNTNFSVYPNPTNSTVNLSYVVAEPGNVKLDLIDLYGRNAQTVIDRKEQAGTYSQTINADELKISKGVYFVRLTINGNSTVKKLIVN